MGFRAIKQRLAGAGALYGDFGEMMARGTKTRDDIRDRAAYVYVTGQFPSHLRRNYMGILRAVTAIFQRPVSLDGRHGNVKLTSDVVNDLELEQHPMVMEVRAKIDEGYIIQPSRGIQARKPFTRVFMYRRKRGGDDKLTVNIDGAIKRGWE